MPPDMKSGIGWIIIKFARVAFVSVQKIRNNENKKHDMECKTMQAAQHKQKKHKK
jgi:hypothetical protein